MGGGLWMNGMGDGAGCPGLRGPVETAAGTYLVDALWRKQRLGAEADGASFHLSADDWQRDLIRQNAVHGTGLRLLRFPVRRLRWDGDACGAEMWRAYRQAE
jgi:very-short-patch-repair endonuclease